jgi:hypothetical protein
MYYLYIRICRCISIALTPLNFLFWCWQNLWRFPDNWGCLLPGYLHTVFVGKFQETCPVTSELNLFNPLRFVRRDCERSTLAIVCMTLRTDLSATWPSFAHIAQNVRQSTGLYYCPLKVTTPYFSTSVSVRGISSLIPIADFVKYVILLRENCEVTSFKKREFFRWYIL